MESIGKIERQEVELELKYCERCGGLWLRPQGANRVYCAGCQLHLAARLNPPEATPAHSRRRKRREQRGKDRVNGLPASVYIDTLQGVAAIEVRA
jgi:Zn-finger nucleic acid-binding protein